MDPKRFTTNPFGELALSYEERAKLVAISDGLILAKCDEYQEYLHSHKRVDESRWKKHSCYGMATTFLERKTASSESKLPVSLMVGALPGTLDENMFGLVSPTMDDMRLKASYLNDCSAAAVLATIVEPSVEDPFRTVVVKWMEIDLPGASIRLVHNRDYVYIESSGILRLKTGDRVGYHLYHSVSFPQAPELAHRVRGNMSYACIFRQEDDRTDCRGTGVMDPGGDLLRQMALMGMIQATMAGSKYSYCGQMKKLTWLVEQRHTQATEGTIPSSAKTLGCTTCSKRIKMSRLGVKKTPTRCKLCFGDLCGTCKITKKLSLFTTNHDLVQRKVPFCVKCLVEATRMDTLSAARHQFVFKRLVQPSVLGLSDASDVSSSS